MGFNQDSIGPATYLQQRNEVVYIFDDYAKGVHKRKDFIFVDQQFVNSIDHTLFKVYVYEPPYKKGQVFKEQDRLLWRRSCCNRQVKTGY